MGFVLAKEYRFDPDGEECDRAERAHALGPVAKFGMCVFSRPCDKLPPVSAEAAPYRAPSSPQSRGGACIRPKTPSTTRASVREVQEEGVLATRRPVRVTDRTSAAQQTAQELLQLARQQRLKQEKAVMFMKAPPPSPRENLVWK